MGSNTSNVKTPNLQATGLMANPSSSQQQHSSSPIPFNHPAPYFTGQQWQMPYPQAYAPAPVPNQQQQQQQPAPNTRQKPNQPQNSVEPHLIHQQYVYPQVMQAPQAPVSYPIPPTQQPFPIWPTNFTYVTQHVPTQVPQQVQETVKTNQQTTQPQQQQQTQPTQQQQQQQTTDNSVPLLKMTQNTGTTNNAQPTEATQQQTTGQTQPNPFVQISQQKFSQPIDYSLPAPPKSFCPQFRAQPKVQLAPLVPQQVQFPTMNVGGMPFGYGGVQPGLYGQQVDYMGGFIQSANPFGTCNQAFQAANTNGYSYQPIPQY